MERVKPAAEKASNRVILSNAKDLALFSERCEILRRLRLLRMTSGDGFFSAASKADGSEAARGTSEVVP